MIPAQAPALWPSWFSSSHTNPPRVAAHRAEEVHVHDLQVDGRQALEIFASSGVCCVDQALPLPVVDKCYRSSEAYLNELMARRDVLLDHCLCQDTEDTRMMQNYFDSAKIEDIRSISFHEIEGADGS